jgi:hypothetical protein
VEELIASPPGPLRCTLWWLILITNLIELRDAYKISKAHFCVYL